MTKPIRGFIRQYQNIAISVVILVFCIVGLIGGVFPAVSKIRDMYQMTSELSETSQKLQTKLTALTALDETTLRAQLDAVISAVPTDKSLPTVFSAVEGVAAQAGVLISAMNISGDTSLSSQSARSRTAQEVQFGTQTIPFTVDIEGPLEAIQQFITIAPQVRRLMRIGTFSITFPENDRPISISVKMDAFYDPSPTTLESASSELPVLSPEDLAVIEKVSGFPLANTEQVVLPPPLIGSSKANPFAP